MLSKNHPKCSRGASRLSASHLALTPLAWCPAVTRCKAWMETAERQAPRPGLAVCLFLCSLPLLVPVRSSPLRRPGTQFLQPRGALANLRPGSAPPACRPSRRGFRPQDTAPLPPPHRPIPDLGPSQGFLAPTTPTPHSLPVLAPAGSLSLVLCGAVPLSLVPPPPQHPVLTLLIPTPLSRGRVRQPRGQGTGPELASTEAPLPELIQW